MQIVREKDFESKKKVSICMLTIDRYYMTKYTFEQLISFVGEDIDVELLVLDNGSKDLRVVEYFKDIADVHIAEPENIGVAKGFNKLLRKCTGDYICIIGNDITVGKDWLNDLIYYADVIDKSGLVGIDWRNHKGFFTPCLSTYDTLVSVWKRNDNTIDGITLFKKEILQKVGGFDETFEKYGYEDHQFALRVFYSGYSNFYIPNQFSSHVGMDINESSEYRKNKDISLQKGKERYQKSLIEMRKNKNYSIPL